MKPRPTGKDKGKGKELVKYMEVSRSEAKADKVQDLITAGADLNVRGKRRTTALMYACRHRCVEIVQQLAIAGSNLDAKDGANGWTALHEACMCMGGNEVDVGIVQCLISSGADLNVVDHNGRTALHNVCYYPKDEAVRALIDGGADLNVVDDYGSTALHLACIKGFVSAVQMLVSAGADTDIKDSNGELAQDQIAFKSSLLPNKSDDNILQIKKVFCKVRSG